MGIGIRAGTATNFQIGYLDFGSGNQTYMDSFWGQNATKFSRTGGSGALSQVDYQTPFIMPLYDAVDISGIGGSGYSKSRILGF